MPTSFDVSNVHRDESRFINLANLSVNQNLYLFIGAGNFNSVNRNRKNSIIDLFTEIEREFTFRECKEIMTNEIVLIVTYEIIKWQDIVCSCYGFLKKKTCLYVVSMARDMNKEDILGSIFLPRERSRGRVRGILRNTALEEE